MPEYMQRYLRIALFASLVGAVWLAYSPGLNGPYVLDDHENLLANPALALNAPDFDGLYRAVVSGDAGIFRRPLANATFALNHILAGSFEPSTPYKITNLAIHILCAVLVYLLVRLVARSPALTDRLDDAASDRVAFIATALWALHPVQITNVLYTVQRMNSLAAVLVLLGLIVYLHGRIALQESRAHGLPTMVAGILLGVSGSLAKENACLTPLFAVVIEYCFFPRPGDNAYARKSALLFHGVMLTVAVLAAAAYIALHPEILTTPYLERDFTLAQRVMTEPRVLWFYLKLILLPDITELGLFHDDIRVSTGLFAPFQTFAALAGILLAIVAAILWHRRYPVPAFAVLWFFAGHVLESGFLGLEIAFEHRNYLPSLGPLTFGAYLLAGASEMARRRPKWMTALAGLTVFALATVTWMSARSWASIDSLTETALRRHPFSPRAQSLGADMAVRHGRYIDSLHHLLRGWILTPADAGFGIDLEIRLARLTAGFDEQLRHQPGMRDAIIMQIAPDLPPGVSIRGKRELILELDPDWRKRVATSLASGPVTVHEVASLDALFGCVTEPPAPCSRIESLATDWLSLAAENPRTSAVYRALILSNYGQLLARAGKYPQALDHVTRATALDPQRPFYELLRITYLERNGMTLPARTALSSLRERDPQLGRHNSTHRDMLRQLEIRLGNQTRTPDATPPGAR